MSENETVTDSGSEPSAVAWVGKLLGPDLLPRTPAGEPATRSLHGSASTGLKTAELSVAPFRIGHYEVLEKIGEGGMGFVFRVRNTELQRYEALKLIAPRNSDDSASRARFEREFLAQAKIEHRHIVPVYAAGTWYGKPYFTMKYVPGGTLSKHLERFRKDETAAATLMAKVARAVHRLHAEKVLHRDLKPHNILLDDGDEPLVADFGLVKNLGEDSDASMTGAPMGTRQYMSPEQTFAHRADYTPACDVWAIGVILYELLAGVRPFPSGDPVEVYLQIREANPPPLLEANPAASPALAAITHRCLAKAPTDRYPTAAAVADDLEAWLAGDAVTATLPPRRPERSRTRSYAAVAAGVVAAGVAVAAVLSGRPPADGPVPPPAAGAVLPVAPMPREVRPPAEQLARGEAVEFVRGMGGIRFPYAPLAGSAPGGTEVNADGVLTVGSVGFLGVELLNHPLPPGTRLEAEMLFTDGRDSSSWAGLFVAGADWPTPAGNRASLVQLVRTVVTPKLPERPYFAVRTSLELLRHFDRPRGLRFSEGVWEQRFDDPPRADAAAWHHLAVTAAPSHVEATWDGAAVRPLTALRAALILAEDGIAAGRPFGDRVGLVVNHAGAAFRNVRLVPPTP